MFFLIKKNRNLCIKLILEENIPDFLTKKVKCGQNRQFFPKKFQNFINFFFQNFFLFFFSKFIKTIN